MLPFRSIVLARFPFTDLSGDKRRPALPESALSADGRDADCPLTLGALNYRSAAILTVDALNAPAHCMGLPPYGVAKS
jgi:hypothetical protein